MTSKYHIWTKFSDGKTLTHVHWETEGTPPLTKCQPPPAPPPPPPPVPSGPLPPLSRPLLNIFLRICTWSR
jgi:hypothetical protein